jgi:hypothetical protein
MWNASPKDFMSQQAERMNWLAGRITQDFSVLKGLDKQKKLTKAM